MRKQTNDTNKRTEIILAALEKNPNLHIEEFIKQLNPPKKSLKKGLLEKLLCACVFIAIGISFLGVTLWIDYKGGSSLTFIAGIISFAIISIIRNIQDIINLSSYQTKAK